MEAELLGAGLELTELANKLLRLSSLFCNDSKASFFPEFIL